MRLLPALILALAAADCTSKPPVIPVRGRVLDPDTRQPLAGVKVSSSAQQTTTDARGAYTLPVAVGGRQLTFELAGRPAAHKFLILDEQVPERQLDALLPATEPTGPALALARGWSFSGALKDFQDQWEAEGDSNLSLLDRYGNSDRLLLLGQGATGKFTDSPAFSKDGGLLFYALNVTGRETDVKRGVYRVPAGGGRPPELMPRPDATITVQSLALSPDGAILLGSGVGNLYRFDRPADATPAVERLPPPVADAGPDVAWGADGSVYLQLPAPNNPLGSRVVRAGWPDFQVDESWSNAGGVTLSAPVVPLEDGSVLAAGTSGEKVAIFRRTAAGETSELLARAVTDVPIAADLAGGWLYYRARSGVYGYDLHLRHLPSGLDLVIATGIKPGRSSSVASRALASKP
jgi:hypothetical protein